MLKKIWNKLKFALLAAWFIGSCALLGHSIEIGSLTIGFTAFGSMMACFAAFITQALD